MRILKQTMIVLVGMKAPWDAYKVAMGAEQEKDTEVDPVVEMTMGKCIEMFAESIPGIIIRLSAIISELNSGETLSKRSIFSLIISLLTTGFVSATISYDFDTDPRMRAVKPDFYGYIIDSSKIRTLLFLIMMFISY